MGNNFMSNQFNIDEVEVRKKKKTSISLSRFADEKQ